MNTEKKDFTYEMGLSVQHMQLTRWKSVLKKKAYAKLLAHVMKQNTELDGNVLRATENVATLCAGEWT